MWPMVFSRIIIGLIIFELTSAGLFLLNKSYPLAALCVPLLFFTVAYKIVMDKAYQRSTQFLPLQLLSEKLGPMRTTIAQSRAVSTSTHSDESSSIHPLATDKNITSDVNEINNGGPSSSKMPSNTTAVAANSSSRIATMKNRKRRTVLDEDDYVADPRKFTDFREPPMTLLDGILNTGMKQYGHPALLGVLPQIWLPVRAGYEDRGIKVANDGTLSPEDIAVPRNIPGKWIWYY